MSAQRVGVVLALVGVLLAGLLLKQGGVSADSYGEPYGYPVKPGQPEWAELPNHEAMLGASQIPPAQLERMSTPDLLQVVLTYPLYGDMLAYNHLQQGFDAVKGNFNGLQELLRREDVATILLETYAKMDPLAIDPTWSIEEIGYYDRNFSYVEVLFAQPEVRQKLSPDQQDQLLALLWSVADRKLQRFDAYGVYGVQNTSWVAGRVLVSQQLLNSSDSEELQSFLDTGSSNSIEAINEILVRLSQVLKMRELTLPIALSGEPTKDNSATVSTPKGTSVPVTNMTWELTSSQRAANDDWVRRTYPAATLLRSSSRKYNCHSYAWYSQGNANSYWMNTPSDDIYWNDGSYYQLNFCPATNARLSYASSDHSAYLNAGGALISKWGQLGLLQHGVGYCPYNSNNVKYYRLS